MSVPPLEDLVAGVLATSDRLNARADASSLAQTDQALAVVRDALERFGVDLDDPTAARAIIVAFEIAAANYQAAAQVAGHCVAGRAATNAMTAAALVAARRHAPEQGV